MIYLICKNMDIAKQQRVIGEAGLPYGVKAISINTNIIDRLRVMDVMLDKSLLSLTMTEK